jgi:hypothetical protein
VALTLTSSTSLRVVRTLEAPDAGGFAAVWSANGPGRSPTHQSGGPPVTIGASSPFAMSETMIVLMDWVLLAFIVLSIVALLFLGASIFLWAVGRYATGSREPPSGSME